jgi:hypothetical protein
LNYIIKQKKNSDPNNPQDEEFRRAVWLIFLKAIYHVILLFLTLLRTWQFFKTFERFGLLTYLVFQVVMESWAFVLFFLLNVSFFALVFISLGMEEGADNNTDFALTPRFII